MYAWEGNLEALLEEGAREVRPQPVRDLEAQVGLFRVEG